MKQKWKAFQSSSTTTGPKTLGEALPNHQCRLKPLKLPRMFLRLNKLRFTKTN
jgi:hypothetical protein